MSVPPVRTTPARHPDRDALDRRVNALVRALERLFATADSESGPCETSVVEGAGSPPAESHPVDARFAFVGDDAGEFRDASSVTATSSADFDPAIVVPGAGDAFGENRRNLPRHAGGCSVLVQHLGGERVHDPLRRAWAWHGSPARGDLLDVSLAGIACLMQQPLERGRRIDVRLWNPRRDVRLERSAIVLRCSPVEPDRWKVVCRFATPLGVDDLQWVAQHVLPHPIV